MNVFHVLFVFLALLVRPISLWSQNTGAEKKSAPDTVKHVETFIIKGTFVNPDNM